MNKLFFISYVYGENGYYQNVQSEYEILNEHINADSFSDYDKESVRIFLERAKVGEMLPLGFGFVIRVTV